MSCRIDRLVAAQGLVILRISGRLVAEHVDTLRASLEQEGRAVAIDLKDVLLADREAVKLLAVAETNGTELTNCPRYIREWITRERRETKPSGPEEGTGGREDIEDA
jgi:hypothetical protein